MATFGKELLIRLTVCSFCFKSICHFGIEGVTMFLIATVPDPCLPFHGVQRRMIIRDLVHDVETIFHLSYVLTASGNLFLKSE